MAFTQADLDRLREMLASGILESGHGSERIKFASFEDLRQRIAMITRELETTGSRRSRVGVIRFKG